MEKPHAYIKLNLTDVGMPSRVGLKFVLGTPKVSRKFAPNKFYRVGPNRNSNRLQSWCSKDS